MSIRLAVAGGMLAWLVAGGVEMASAQRGGFQLPPLTITSPSFEDGGIVPEMYAGRGGNVSPALNWTGAPDTTQSYAIIFHDLDVALQGGVNDVLHWIVWNIPGDATGLPEGAVPEGAVVGPNITGQNQYFGPGAPAGPRYHHYVFELYALNETLDLAPNASRADLLAAMEGKVVAKAAYVGRFRSQPPQ